MDCCDIVLAEVHGACLRRQVGKGGLGEMGEVEGGHHFQPRRITPLTTAVASDSPRMWERCPQESCCTGLEPHTHWGREWQEDRLKIKVLAPLTRDRVLHPLQVVGSIACLASLKLWDS